MRTGALMAAPDGRIVYLSAMKSLEALDPRSGRFVSIVHPAGREIVSAERAANGSFQMITRDRPEGPSYWETFDGSRFTELQKMGILPDKHDDIRTNVRAADGA